MPRDHVSIEAPAFEHDEPIEVIGAVSLVCVELLDELRVQRDVAVVVEFADRDAQPVPAANLDDGVGAEFAELADAQPGSGEHLDDQASGRVGFGGGAHQFRGVGVGQESRERVVGCGEVTVEDQDSSRGVGVVPFRHTLEERAQRSERETDRDRRQSPSGVVLAESGAEVAFEPLDMVAFDVDEANDPRGLVRDEVGELAQHSIRCRARSQDATTQRPGRGSAASSQQARVQRRRSRASRRVEPAAFPAR